MKPLILTPEQVRKLDFIKTSPSADFSTLLHFELKELAVYWSFYSGKIEGNTYSFVETESLLKDDITSPKRYEDAIMLKNLYNTFIACVEQIKKVGPMKLDAFTLKGVHSMLMDGLLPIQSRGALRERGVRISGTGYLPPADRAVIKEQFAEILEEQYAYESPIERSIFLHCNLARLQPFVDGNKRTSRLVESITLMNAGLVPVRTDRAEDFVRYRDAIVAFYETEDYGPYTDFALNTQIERINEVAPPEQRYEPRC